MTSKGTQGNFWGVIMMFFYLDQGGGPWVDTYVQMYLYNIVYSIAQWNS